MTYLSFSKQFYFVNHVLTQFLLTTDERHVKYKMTEVSVSSKLTIFGAQSTVDPAALKRDVHNDFLVK